MHKPFIKAANILIPVTAVERADISCIENGIVDITYDGGKLVRVEGFDALEAVMLLNPSALEGRRLRWVKHAWAFHNLVAHPIMQIMVWIGLKKQGLWLHDVTVPKPLGFREIKNPL